MKNAECKMYNEECIMMNLREHLRHLHKLIKMSFVIFVLKKLESSF